MHDDAYRAGEHFQFFQNGAPLVEYLPAPVRSAEDVVALRPHARLRVEERELTVRLSEPPHARETGRLRIRVPRTRLAARGSVGRAVGRPATNDARVARAVRQRIRTVRTFERIALNPGRENRNADQQRGNPQREQLEARAKSDMATLGRLIKDAGIRSD